MMLKVREQCLSVFDCFAAEISPVKLKQIERAMPVGLKQTGKRP